MERIERPQSCQVEDRSQIDEESIVALSGKYLDAIRERRDGRCGKRVVVWRRPGTDVVGRCRNVRPKQLAVSVLVALDERHAVGLRTVPVRIRQRRDLADVVEK